MIVRFKKDGKIRGGSLSAEDKRIVSSGEVLALDEVELLAHANRQDRLRGLTI
jgi:hypothetical protein